MGLLWPSRLASWIANLEARSSMIVYLDCGYSLDSGLEEAWSCDEEDHPAIVLRGLHRHHMNYSARR